MLWARAVRGSTNSSPAASIEAGVAERAKREDRKERIGSLRDRPSENTWLAGSLGLRRAGFPSQTFERGQPNGHPDTGLLAARRSRRLERRPLLARDRYERARS